MAYKYMFIMGQDYILSSPFLEAEIWLVTISNF